MSPAYTGDKSWTSHCCLSSGVIFLHSLSVCPLLPDRLLQDGSGCAYDKESLAIIKLNNTTVLYLKEVTKFLALVCILREEGFERKGLHHEMMNSLLDYSGSTKRLKFKAG